MSTLTTETPQLEEPRETQPVEKRKPRQPEREKIKQKQENKSKGLLRRLTLVAIVIFVATALVAYDYQITQYREAKEEWNKKLSKVEQKNEALLQQVKELEVFRDETQRLQEENQQLRYELNQIKDAISMAKQEFWDTIGTNSVPVIFWKIAEIDQNINATYFFLNGTRAPVETTVIKDADIYHNNISVAYSLGPLNENLRVEIWVQTKENLNPPELQIPWKDYVPIDSLYTQKTDEYYFNQTTRDYALSLISPSDTTEDVIDKIIVDVYDKSENKNCQILSKKLITVLRSVGIESRIKIGLFGPYDIGDSIESGGHAWVEIRIGGCWLEYNANGPWVSETCLIGGNINRVYELPPGLPEAEEFSHKFQLLSINPMIVTRYKDNTFKIEYFFIPRNP